MREPLRDPERLKHIFEAINNIEKATKGKTLEDISSDFILRHALTWNIMIIGEAANKLSLGEESFRSIWLMVVSSLCPSRLSHASRKSQSKSEAHGT